MSEHYIYGLHAVSALLANSQREVYKLYVNQERMDTRLEELINKALLAGIETEKLSMQTMQNLFPNYTHQGVVAAALALPQYDESDLIALLEASKNPGLILILDCITDPHNLGACLRTADAAGVDFVIIPKDRSANITPVVTKVASGAAESVPVVRVTNLVRAMKLLKDRGVWIYGADHKARASLYAVDGTRTIAIAMGAEGEGLRRLTRDNCDGLFSLLMQGQVESLNVSVAAGIALYEVVRQRCKHE
jgi:23S rRNA (guanosine2251-2'-O)-methyltransferase